MGNPQETITAYLLLLTGIGWGIFFLAGALVIGAAETVKHIRTKKGTTHG